MYFKMDRTCINHRSNFLSWLIEQIYLKTSLKGPHLLVTSNFLWTQKKPQQFLQHVQRVQHIVGSNSRPILKQSVHT
jgi:hypothetical protein